MKKVKLFRVKMNESGHTPIGWPVGMITGFSSEEAQALDRNPFLRGCLEEVEVETVPTKVLPENKKDNNE